MADSERLDDYVKSDDALFHYTRASIALEKILYDSRIKLSLLKNTNDPHEYKFMFLGMDGSSPQQLYQNAHPVFDRMRRHESRVLCFCTNAKPTIVSDDETNMEDDLADNIGWQKSRMWAQYGENHHGICLVFSRSQIEGEIKGSTKLHSGFIAENVKYMNMTRHRIPIKARTLNGNHLVRDGIDSYCMNHIRSNAGALFFTKHIDYRDESEYRVVVFDPNNKMESMDISQSIRGVIAGDRTPKVYVPLIRELSGRYGIECRRAYWSGDQWHLLLMDKEK